MGLIVIIMQVSVQIRLNWYWTGTELGNRVYATMQVYISVWKYASVQVCQNANMQICMYANMQVCKYASMQVCKHASMQIFKYLNT